MACVSLLLSLIESDSPLAVLFTSDDSRVRVGIAGSLAEHGIGPELELLETRREEVNWENIPEKGAGWL